MKEPYMKGVAEPSGENETLFNILITFNHMVSH